MQRRRWFRWPEGRSACLSKEGQDGLENSASRTALQRKATRKLFQTSINGQRLSGLLLERECCLPMDMGGAKRAGAYLCSSVSPTGEV